MYICESFIGSGFSENSGYAQTFNELVCMYFFTFGRSDLGMLASGTSHFEIGSLPEACC